MSINIIVQSPTTVTGIRPGQWFLTSSEDFSTITSAGYLNSVAQAGYEFQPNDVIFAQYADDRFDMFVVSVDTGIFTLDVYSPGDNSFPFLRTIFVAKGGSNLNAGSSIGRPKLTVTAAIAALMPNTTVASLVWVMDDGNYNENLVLPFNVTVFAPNATFDVTSGDVFTINDTGIQTLASVTCASATAQSGDLINILGVNSTLMINANTLEGDIAFEGNLVLRAETLNNAVVTGDGVFAPEIKNAVMCAFSQTGTTVGKIGSLTGVSNIHGGTYFVDHLLFQTTPATITAGKTLAIADSNTHIVYNSASPGNITLPKTADVAIPLGTNVEFTQLGLGAAIFVAGTGVTIVSAEGATVETNGAGTTSKAWKYTDTIWVISGDIAAVGP